MMIMQSQVALFTGLVALAVAVTSLVLVLTGGGKHHKSLFKTHSNGYTIGIDEKHGIRVKYGPDGSAPSVEIGVGTTTKTFPLAA
tara:strand:- start:958 stop:1212 length:255 start_codon:yes stop_codon:yes gene_type:complete